MNNMTEQEFDHIDYRKALLNLPKDIQWLVSILDEQAEDFPDFNNITITKMLCGAPDCYFQVYRIPKDLATQPVGNLFGGVTVYQTRPADNVEEMLDECRRAFAHIAESSKEVDISLKATRHTVEWIFQNYEIGRRLPKVNNND